MSSPRRSAGSLHNWSLLSTSFGSFIHLIIIFIIVGMMTNLNQ
jgi:hypothetical protein